MPAKVGVDGAVAAAALGMEKKAGIFENMASPWVFKKESASKVV